MNISFGNREKIASTIAKLNWSLVLAILLFVCCSCIHSKPTETEQLSEHSIIDSFYPGIYESDDLVERAAPRLGRASPRLGRASPRLGRRIPSYMLSRLNHAGRYYIGDDESLNDYPYEFDASANEKRAAPRLGRSI